MHLLPRQQRCTLLIMLQLKKASSKGSIKDFTTFKYMLTRNHMKSVALLRDIKQTYLQTKIGGEDSDAFHVHWLNDLEKNQITTKQ